MNDNIDFFWDQVKLYEEIEKRQRRRKYLLFVGVFLLVIGLIYLYV